MHPAHPPAVRVALFGGSFDPPHRGHMAIACAAARASQLDRVLLVPAGRQPLKPHGATAPYEDRLRMVELLCEAARRECPGVSFEASDLERPHADGAANYTIDTLRAAKTLLAAQQAAPLQMFFIVGQDAFADLPRWREPERLLREAEWIVVSRPGSAPPANLDPERLSRVHRLDGIAEPESATELRNRLEHGEDSTDWLTPEVCRYIQEHGLYAIAADTATPQ